MVVDRLFEQLDQRIVELALQFGSRVTTYQNDWDIRAKVAECAQYVNSCQTWHSLIDQYTGRTLIVEIRQKLHAGREWHGLVPQHLEQK